MGNDSVDPVCGMQVEEDDCAAKTEYRGKTYFFCTSDCKKRFEEHPEKFVVAEEKAREP